MSEPAVTALDSLRIALHLTGPVGQPTAGTFVATGIVGDGGTTSVVERYRSLGETGTSSVVVHGAERLAGLHGAIAIVYDGVFRTVAPGLFSGSGAWQVTGGSYAYSLLDGGGTWTATARLDGGRMTVDVIYEGKGDLGVSCA
jgi:hypothetical protein